MNIMFWLFFCSDKQPVFYEHTGSVDFATYAKFMTGDILLMLHGCASFHIEWWSEIRSQAVTWDTWRLSVVWTDALRAVYLWSDLPRCILMPGVNSLSEVYCFNTPMGGFDISKDCTLVENIVSAWNQNMFVLFTLFKNCQKVVNCKNL